MTLTEQAEHTPNSWRSRAFGLLWTSATVSSVGDGAYVAGAPLLAAYLTKDPVAVSAVSIAVSAPWLLVSLWSGAIVDRMSRRTVMIAADVARFIGLLGLVALVVTGIASIWSLALTSFLIVSGKCFFDPAAQALVPHVIGRDAKDLATANGRLAAAETVGQSFIGPPIGSALFAVGPWAPFALDAVSFGLSATTLSAVPSDQAPDGPKGQSIPSAVQEGFAYLRRSPRLMALAFAVGFLNVGYMLAAATLVLYAQQVLKVPGYAYGLLLASTAVGAVISGAAAGSVVRRLGTGGTLVAGGVLQAIGWAALAATPSPWIAPLPLVLLGAGTTLITVAAVTTRQETVPDHLLGRVVSAFRVIGNGLALGGAALGGVIAASWGLTSPLVVGAVVSATTVAALGLPLLKRRS